MDKVIDWLLEDNNPAVKYNTLKNILSKKLLPEEEKAFNLHIISTDPVKSLLELNSREESSGSELYSFSPMYKSVFWQLYFLSLLGATNKSPAISVQVKKFVENIQSEKGAFPSAGRYKGNLICMQGIVLEMLLLMGYFEDDFTLMLLNFINDNVYKNDFRCKYRQNLKCPWGATKVLKAMNLLPNDFKNTGSLKTIERARKFLISHDISEANYPRKKERSNRWFLFGFPRGTGCDVLELTTALVDSGCSKKNNNLKKALEYILSKKNDIGQWKMEYSLNGKMLVDIEKINKPSKWITYMALKTLVKSNYINI